MKSIILHLEDKIMDKVKQIITYLAVDCIGYKTGQKLWPFFSTVSKNFEANGWGTKFPVLLQHLCDNSKVEIKDLLQLKQEVEFLCEEFPKLKIKDIILDFDNPEKKLFCENQQDYELPALEFFANENGFNYLEIFTSAVNDALEVQFPLEIKQMTSED